MIFRVTLIHAIFLFGLFLVYQISGCRETYKEIVNVGLVASPPLISGKNQPISTPMNENSASRLPMKEMSPPEKTKGSSTAIVKRPSAKNKIPPKPNYRSPEEIRRSALASNPTSRRDVAKSAPTRQKFNESEFLRRFHGERTSSKKQSSGSSAKNDHYYQRVISEIYHRWEQPSRTEIGDAKYEVKIRLKIHRSGRLLDRKIVKNSHHVAMDASVTKLLGTLERLPPFPSNQIEPDTVTYDITLVLK